MVERSTASAIEETIGDAAYGDGETRRIFADAGRTLVAKLPRRPERKRFPKEDFKIDLESGTCTCPAGHTTGKVYRIGSRRDRTGRLHGMRGFRFDAALCGACPLRELCVSAGEGKGRTVSLHPQEALLQRARALQRSEGYAEYRQRRVAVEHRLARLVQLGMRQARYFGRSKTLFQLLMAAAVANLTLVAGKLGMMGEGAGASENRSVFSTLFLAVISTSRRSDTRISRTVSLTLTTWTSPE